MAELNDLLKFDGLATAEKLTGKSYKEDPDTEALGVALFLHGNQAKQDALISRDDTYYSSSYDNTLRIFDDLGFEVIHNHTFPGRDGEEDFRVLWHPDGVLGVVESYTSTNRSTNNAKIYYNWRGEDPWSLISSGRILDDVLVGDHDVREGLRHHIGSFRAKGQFLPVWIDQPFLWLVDYSQSRADGYDHKSITRSVIETFPIEIQEAIRG